jgi:DNA repair protein RadA
VIALIAAKTIEDLPGVGKALSGKLVDAGFESVSSLAAAVPAALVEAAGINESAARRIISAARESADLGFFTGRELLEKRKGVGRLTTGSSKLDQLLGGGVETQAITEFYGQFASGKTQLCHQLAVNVQLPRERGGLEKKAVYLDTENTTRPERMVQMAEHLGLDPETTLENIHVARAYTTDDQMVYVERIEELVGEEDIGLVVVDSLTSQFRAEYSGRGTLAERQQRLNRHMHDLQRLGDRHNLAVVVTNQVMARPDYFFGDPTAPIGGHVVGHSATFRVYLKRSKYPTRVARLVDSPCLPEGEATFKVETGGIMD